MQKFQQVIVLSIFSLILLLPQFHPGVEATKSTKSERGSDYDGEENGAENLEKGQHFKIPFRATKKSVLDGEHDKKTNAASHGAGGSFSLQIQAEVPLQTAYSPKKGGSGVFDGSSGDGEVSSDPFASFSWLSSPIILKDFA